MKIKLYIITLSLFSIFQSFGQNDFTAIADGKLLSINRNTGAHTIKTSISNLPSGAKPSRFSYSKKSNCFYGITPVSGGTHLYKITPDGEYTDIGKLTINGGTIYFAESIAIDRRTQKIYVSASANGSSSQGDYYSESILEVDSLTAVTTLTKVLNTDEANPDADVMTFDDNGNLYFMDGIPGGRNLTKFYKTTLTTTDQSPILYSSTYEFYRDLTIRDDTLFYVKVNELYKYNLSTNTLSYVGTVHSSSDFGGTAIRALSWHVSCDTTKTMVDISICPNEDIDISTSAEGTYQWSNGETTQVINTKTPGLYTVVTQTPTCTITDSFTVIELPKPPVNLGSDITLCEDSILTLDAYHNSIISYTWNDGSTNSELQINDEGIYHVTVSNGSCSNSDTVNVSMINKLELGLGEDRVLCNGLSLPLQIGIGPDIIWENNSSSNNRIITESGLYWAEINNECFSARDTINILFEKCNCDFYLPNAFTPDFNNLNELYKPVYDCPITEYRMIIYNRWGEKLFETTDPNKGWDGIYMSKQVQQGAYIALVLFKTSEHVETRKKTITVLR
ncbi:MAG: hypothetical protein COA58_09955 [Bacteroidetes bacterium]|nr:MAG: hypothetical protein COA58_09955 [Bacteroidota bacterium]